MSAATILVADDDPDILELVKLRLEIAGHPVLAARDGQEALELVREHMPALCILDVQMPRMTGFDVLHSIRADDDLRDIPVILLTASVQDQDVIRGLESGADDYLRKPFTPVDLQTRVAALLNGR
jgi:CheY-like chemotaxis protein